VPTSELAAPDPNLWPDIASEFTREYYGADCYKNQAGAAYACNLVGARNWVYGASKTFGYFINAYRRYNIVGRNFGTADIGTFNAGNMAIPN